MKDEELLSKFKAIDLYNYTMYKSSGVSDTEIIQLLKTNTMKRIYNL